MTLPPARSLPVLSLALAGALGAPAAAADTPDVVVSIKPLHSLVAGVMAGIGEPHLLMEGGQSPHTYSMRPSDAAALESAAVVFWAGPQIENFLPDALDTLAADAVTVALADADGVSRLPVRTGDDWDTHDHSHGDHGHGDHGHGDHGHDDHAHDDHDHDEHARDDHDHDEHAHDDHGHDEHAHDDHGHEEHAHDDHGHDEHAHDDHGHDEHAHDDHAHDEHDHGHEDHGDHADAMDTHVWLDPVNAQAMVRAVAETLATADPANAAAYAANADTVIGELDTLTAELDDRLAPVRQRPFIVFHDAYQYLEARFGLTAAGSITISPEVQPSAARVQEMHDLLARLDVVCVFSEPQFEPALVNSLITGTDAGTGVLDPLGVDLPAGPALYGDLLRRNADALIDCLS